MKKAMTLWAAWCLTLVLLLASIPVSAFAEEPAQTTITQSETDEIIAVDKEDPALGTESQAEEDPALGTESQAEEDPALGTESQAEEDPALETESQAEEDPALETEPEFPLEEEDQTLDEQEETEEQITAHSEPLEFRIENIRVWNTAIDPENPVITETTQSVEYPCHVTPSEDGSFFISEYVPYSGHNSRLTHHPKVYFTGTIPQDSTIQRVYTGDGREFTLYEDGGTALFLLDGEGNFEFVLDYTQATVNMAVSASHFYAGCYYFELDDGTIYPLVVDDGYLNVGPGKDIETGEDTTYIPSFVSLRDASSGTWLGADYEVVGLDKAQSSDSRSSVVQAVLRSDTPVYLQAQVRNSAGLYPVETSTSGPFKVPAARRAWVVVNGERQPDFVNTYASGSRGAVFSAPFALKPGLNVVEVCTSLHGAYNSSQAPWMREGKSSPATIDTVSIVYLINYDGPEAEEPFPQNSDTGLSVLSVYTPYNTNSKGQRGERPVTWDETFGVYYINLPEYLNNQSDSWVESRATSKYNTGLLITAIPNDAQSTAVVVDETNTGPDGIEGNFVVAQVGALTAVQMDYISSDSRFDIQVTASDGTKKTYPVQITYVSSEAGLTSAAIDGASFDVSFGSAVYDYYIDFNNASEQATLTLTAAEGMSLAVNGEAYTGPVTVSASEPYYKVTVTAADQITTTDYFFVPRYGSDGNWTIPFRTISSDTKAQAEKMLEQYTASLDSVKEFGSYWNIFFVRATETQDSPFDFDGLNVYDVRKHTMKQATDWAACIMEIVMLGGNPYDFPRYVNGELDEHFDYVQGLIDCGGGPFANNVWYSYAANAAGVPDIFFESNKTNSLKSSFDLDTRAWTIASVSTYLDTKEMVRYIDGLHDSQSLKAGEASDIGLFRNNVMPLGYNNLYTNGCVLSAIASAGADVNTLFALNGTNPLTLLEKHAEKTGENLLVKDMIIGLGDIINGSNVWARYALTEERYDALIDKAEENGISTDGMPAYGGTDYGKKYFELYSQVGAALAAKGDYSMTPRVTYGLSYQIFEDDVNALPAAEAITEADLDNVEKVIGEYEALTDSYKKLISEATLEKYHAVVSAALKVQDATGETADIYDRILALPDPLVIGDSEKDEVEAIRAAYDALSDGQKELIDWSGASTLAKLVDCEAAFKPVVDPVDPSNPSNPSGPSGPSGPSTPTRMTITFELLGAPNDGENGTVNTLKAGNLETWYTTTQTFNASSISAEQAFTLIMDKAGIAWRGNSNNEFNSIYITGIQSPKTGEWMEEFTTTNTSGWMYTVNGKHPNVGMTNTTLYDGDTFLVHYTDDYTQEQDASEWAPSTGTGTGTGTDTNTPGTNTPDKEPSVSTPTITTTVEGGASTTIVEEGSLDEILKDADMNTPVIVAPDIPESETVTKSEVVLTRGDMGAVAEKETSLKISTPLAEIVLSHEALRDVAGEKGQEKEVVTITAAVQENGTSIQVAVNDKVLDKVDGGLLVTLPAAREELGTGSVMVLVDADGKETVLKKSVLSEGGVTALLDGSCTVKVVDNAVRFSDTAQHWASSDIDFVSSRELFLGTAEDVFDPEGTMTRAMLATVLHRLENTPDTTVKEAFGDVPAGTWYADAVAWASENGIVNGYSAGVFAPDDSITREQMAVMMYRYSGFLGLDISGRDALDSFQDANEISDWAMEAIQWAVRAGLMEGRGKDVLDPQGTATRAEVAAIMQRLVKLMVQ